jgi:hypothetical protein
MQSIASCHSTNLRIASHCRHLFASRNVHAPQIIGSSHMDHRSRRHRDPAVLPLRRTKALQKQTLASSDQNQSASKTPQRNKDELERNLVRSLEVMSSRQRGGEAKGCETEGDPKFRKSPPNKPKFLTNISIFFF